MDDVNLDYISNQPLGLPPPGVQANYINPECLANSIYISGGICLFLISIFSLLRFYAKIKILKDKSWDDCKD